MSLLKEIKNLYYFWKTPGIEEAIVFYAEHRGYYPAFEGIIERLTNKYNKNIHYITSDLNDPILQTANPRIKSFYLNKLLPHLMSNINCSIFVMTLTDLNQFHLKRSVNPVHYLYIFHALVSTHMIYRKGAFDHYDSILCCGPHQIKEIRRHEELNKLSPKKLINAGYYRLERIYRAYKNYSKNKSSSKTILIAPSWGDNNILESCGEKLVNILLEAGYKVRVRPHPETARRLPNLLDLLNSKFGDNQNFILERSVATDNSLLEADILISDYSGISLEYAFGTERPVLFLDVPIKIKNPKFKELGIEPLELSLRSELGEIVSPEKLNIVPKVISELISKRNIYKKRIIKLRKQYVPDFGKSSEIGTQYIINLIKDKDKLRK